MGIDSNTTSVAQYSTLELVKIAKFTESAQTLAGNTTTTIISHNLEYIPIVLINVDNGSGVAVPLPTFSYDATGNLDQVIKILNVTTAQFSVIHSERLSNNGPLSFKYYLLKDKAI